MATGGSAHESAVIKRGYAVADAVFDGASPWLYEDLPSGSRDVAQNAYGFGLIRSEMHSVQTRQRDATAQTLASEIGMRMSRALRPDNAVVDYQGALLIASAIRQTLVGGANGNDANGAQQWRWVSQTVRVAADSTYLLVEQRYHVHHLLSTI